MARNRALHERLLTYAPPHHFPAYIATTLERDENGAYLKIPLISPLAAAYKHQACKYCGSFEVGSSHLPCRFSLFHVGSHWHKCWSNHTFSSQCPPKKMCNEERDSWLVNDKKWLDPRTLTCLPATIVFVSWLLIRVVDKTPPRPPRQYDEFWLLLLSCPLFSDVDKVIRGNGSHQRND